MFSDKLIEIYDKIVPWFFWIIPSKCYTWNILKNNDLLIAAVAAALWTAIIFIPIAILALVFKVKFFVRIWKSRPLIRMLAVFGFFFFAAYQHLKQRRILTAFGIVGGFATIFLSHAVFIAIVINIYFVTKILCEVAFSVLVLSGGSNNSFAKIVEKIENL